MAAFDRNPALERQQIHEIAVNVARRLLRILERSRSAPPYLASEIASSARVITGIQHDIDQLMAALPPHAALEVAVLTHVLSSQQQALGLIEQLETSLANVGAQIPPHDPSRTHAGPTASREIEHDAFRQPAPTYAPPRPLPSYAPAPGMPPANTPPPPTSFGRRDLPPVPRQLPPNQPLPRQPLPSYQQPSQPPQSRTPGPSAPRLPAKQRAQPPKWASITANQAVAAARTWLLNPRAAATAAALSVMVALLVSAVSLIPSGAPKNQADARIAPGQKLDGRLGASPETAETIVAAPAMAAVATPSMEQPYLVVLATRRSTEELQQDFTTFKQAYPTLLGSARARVDRVQGQDRQTWYRLSLIPPQARDEAKALCSNLRTAGLSGCWIKQVPLN